MDGLITIHKQTVRSISSAAFQGDAQPIMISLGLLNMNQIDTYMSILVTSFHDILMFTQLGR